VGSASAVCIMAEPWTTVAWARGPRDRTTLPPPRRTGWPACLRRDLVSLGHRSGASHGRRPPRCASGWQRQLARQAAKHVDALPDGKVAAQVLRDLGPQLQIVYDH
jgi:hypothetical protein